MSTVDQLPRPYQLLNNIVASLDLIANGTVSALAVPAVIEAAQSFAQELAMELWKAGQTEHRVMAGDCDYDPPLWARGMFIEEVTRAVGVPTVAASDPAKDYGRGRTIR